MKNSTKQKQFCQYSYVKSCKLSLFVLLCSLSFLSNPLWAKTIEVTSDQIDNLQEIIDKAESGDVLYFTDSIYDLSDGEVIIRKPLIFKGLDPKDYDPSYQGANGLQTTLMNVKTIRVESDYVEFYDLKIAEPQSDEPRFFILVDMRTESYKQNFRTPEANDGSFRKGIVMKNIEINGGFYGLFAGNGVEGAIEHVSFLNYSRIGYINDRRSRLTAMPQVTFDYCRFVPNIANLGFDDRGISFDAGNTEFPIVWNGHSSYVKNSFFLNTGVAMSRCHSIEIADNTFQDEKGFIDLIHIEEWSYNVTVKNNLFDCRFDEATGLPTRVMQFDRELATVNHIFITDNKIVGTIDFFISAYAPNNVSITGNDFTQAKGSNFVLGLDFYESRNQEPIDPRSEFVSYNVTILDNPGIENVNPLEKPDIQMHVPLEGGNIRINNVPESQQNLIKFDYPKPLISDGIYEIENLRSGKRLVPSANNEGLTAKPASEIDGLSSKWKVSFDPPYHYSIRSVHNGRKIEAHKGYTEAEIFENTVQDERPFLVATENYSPRWALVSTGEESQFEIFTGGNEKQSALVDDVNDGIKLIFGKKFNPDFTRSPIKFGDDAKWNFIRQDSRRAKGRDQEENIFALESNPVKNILAIRYENKSESVVDILFYDMGGRIVKEDKLFSHAKTSYDISGFRKGMYLVKTSNGHSEKFVKD